MEERNGNSIVDFDKENWRVVERLKGVDNGEATGRADKKNDKRDTIVDIIEFNGRLYILKLNRKPCNYILWEYSVTKILCINLGGLIHQARDCILIKISVKVGKDGLIFGHIRDDNDNNEMNSIDCNAKVTALLVEFHSSSDVTIYKSSSLSKYNSSSHVNKNGELSHQQTLVQYLQENIDLVDEGEFLSIVFQVLLSLSISQRELSFTHYDLHPNNIIIENLSIGDKKDSSSSANGKLSNTIIVYEDVGLVVFSNGSLPRIIDYEYSYVDGVQGLPFDANLGLFSHGYFPFSSSAKRDVVRFVIATLCFFVDTKTKSSSGNSEQDNMSKWNRMTLIIKGLYEVFCKSVYEEDAALGALSENRLSEYEKRKDREFISRFDSITSAKALRQSLMVDSLCSPTTTEITHKMVGFPSGLFGYGLDYLLELVKSELCVDYMRKHITSENVISQERMKHVKQHTWNISEEGQQWILMNFYDIVSSMLHSAECPLVKKCEYPNKCTIFDFFETLVQVPSLFGEKDFSLHLWIISSISQLCDDQHPASPSREERILKTVCSILNISFEGDGDQHMNIWNQRLVWLSVLISIYKECVCDLESFYAVSIKRYTCNQSLGTKHTPFVRLQTSNPNIVEPEVWKRYNVENEYKLTIDAFYKRYNRIQSPTKALFKNMFKPDEHGNNNTSKTGVKGSVQNNFDSWTDPLNLCLFLWQCYPQTCNALRGNRYFINRSTSAIVVSKSKWKVLPDISKVPTWVFDEFNSTSHSDIVKRSSVLIQSIKECYDI